MNMFRKDANRDAHNVNTLVWGLGFECDSRAALRRIVLCHVDIALHCMIHDFLIRQHPMSYSRVAQQSKRA